MNDILDPLNTINRIDTPSFLYTRIQEKIKNKEANFMTIFKCPRNHQYASNGLRNELCSANAYTTPV